VRAGRGARVATRARRRQTERRAWASAAARARPVGGTTTGPGNTAASNAARPATYMTPDAVPYKNPTKSGGLRTLRTGRSTSDTDSARGSTAPCSGMLPTASARARRPAGPSSPGELCERAIMDTSAPRASAAAGAAAAPLGSGGPRGGGPRAAVGCDAVPAPGNTSPACASNGDALRARVAPQPHAARGPHATTCQRHAAAEPWRPAGPCGQEPLERVRALGCGPRRMRAPARRRVAHPRISPEHVLAQACACPPGWQRSRAAAPLGGSKARSKQLAMALPAAARTSPQAAAARLQCCAPARRAQWAAAAAAAAASRGHWPRRGARQGPRSKPPRASGRYSAPRRARRRSRPTPLPGSLLRALRRPCRHRLRSSQTPPTAHPGRRRRRPAPCRRARARSGSPPARAWCATARGAAWRPACRRAARRGRAARRRHHRRRRRRWPGRAGHRWAGPPGAHARVAGLDMSAALQLGVLRLWRGPSRAVRLRGMPQRCQQCRACARERSARLLGAFARCERGLPPGSALAAGTPHHSSSITSLPALYKAGNAGLRRAPSAEGAKQTWWGGSQVALAAHSRPQRRTGEQGNRHG